MMTNEELKQQMKNDHLQYEAAVASQTAELSLPVSSPSLSRDELKKEIQNTAEDSKFTQNNRQTKEEYKTEQEKIINTLKHPVDKDYPSGLANCHIGNLNISTYDNLKNYLDYATPEAPADIKEIYNQMYRGDSADKLPSAPEHADKLIDRSKLHIIDHTENNNISCGGFYNAATHETTVKLYPDDTQNQYIAICTLIHETNHKKQYENDGVGTLNTPVNSYKIDRLQETTSSASEYLALAQLYTNLKQQGIKTTTLNYQEDIDLAYDAYQTEHSPLPQTQEEADNFKEIKFSEFLKQQENRTITLNNEPITADKLLEKYPELDEKKSYEIRDFLRQKNLDIKITQYKEVPIEEILNTKPDLKNFILEKGFDAKDPQSVRDVVELASNNWHTYVKESYKKQHLGNVHDNYTLLTFSEQLKTLKDEDKTYKEVSNNVLQNVYIGQDTYIDLTHCQDLLDTCSREEASTALEQNKRTHLSLEEMEAINNHLEKLGLTTDEEKHKYLTDFVGKTIYREQTADPELLNILLSKNHEICYADNIAVTYDKDNNPSSARKNNNASKVYRIDREMLTDNKTNEPAPKENLTAKNNSSQKLNPALMLHLQRQR